MKDNLKYAGLSDCIVDNSDEIIILWDKKELPLKIEMAMTINQGGTYYTYKRAKESSILVKNFK